MTSELSTIIVVNVLLVLFIIMLVGLFYAGKYLNLLRKRILDLENEYDNSTRGKHEKRIQELEEKAEEVWKFYISQTEDNWRS